MFTVSAIAALDFDRGALDVSGVYVYRDPCAPRRWRVSGTAQREAIGTADSPEAAMSLVERARSIP